MADQKYCEVTTSTNDVEAFLTERQILEALKDANTNATDIDNAQVQTVLQRIIRDQSERVQRLLGGGYGPWDSVSAVPTSIRTVTAVFVARTILNRGRNPRGEGALSDEADEARRFLEDVRSGKRSITDDGEIVTGLRKPGVRTRSQEAQSGLSLDELKDEGYPAFED